MAPTPLDGGRRGGIGAALFWGKGAALIYHVPGTQEKLSFGDSREFRARQSSGFDKQYLRSSTMIAVE